MQADSDYHGSLPGASDDAAGDALKKKPRGQEERELEEDKDDLHALLERAAKLMVKAGYSAYSVKIKVAGKEKSYGLMESSVYMRIIMARGKRGTPPKTK